MHTIQAYPFGKTQEGCPVTRYVLEDGLFAVSILDYGGTVQMLRVPDRHGRPVDVALGFETVTAYETHGKFLGALIGRCANRIAQGTFSLHDTIYHLDCNEGAHHLHGGKRGFDKKIWRVQQVANGLRLTLHSEDGEGGYPGNLEVAVTYTLQQGALCLDYQAVSDADTLCNLTNHTYFNLAGHGSGAVGQQYIRIFAEQYTPTDRFAIPTGALATVADTPMDLRRLQRIGHQIDADFAQLHNADGFDHNWVTDARDGALTPAAVAYAEETGIRMQVETTLPGVQFYTGNHLDGCPRGKGGVYYGRRSGFCLETQFYPDAIHHPHFPQPILRKGETYSHQTVYRFSPEACDGS